MNEYEQKAKDFLAKTKAKLTIKYINDVDGFPFNNKDKSPHRMYECTLTRFNRPGGVISGREYKFPFYGSYADWKAGKDPCEYDVLACLETYCPDTIDEFVAEYGYEVHEWADVHRIEEMYDSVRKQYDELSRMFSELELDALAEIN